MELERLSVRELAVLARSCQRVAMLQLVDLLERCDPDDRPLQAVLETLVRQESRSAETLDAHIATLPRPAQGTLTPDQLERLTSVRVSPGAEHLGEPPISRDAALFLAENILTTLMGAMSDIAETAPRDPFARRLAVERDRCQAARLALREVRLPVARVPFARE